MSVKKGIVLSLVAASCCSALFGYDISDAVKSAEPAREPQSTTPPSPLVITQENAGALELNDSEKILIKDFDVQGAPGDISFEETLSQYRNKELSIGEINDVAAKITQALRTNGYLTAKAYVPKQSVSDGILAIKVIVGKYGKISYNNPTYVADFVVEKTLNNTLSAGDDVTSSSLERAMLLSGDLPGTNVPRVTIQEGDEFGTSNFNFEYESAKRFGGYITADNYGSRLTGKNRLSLGLDVNSPFGFGDRLNLSGVQSKAADLRDGRVAYSFPLYSNGLRGELSAERTDYELGQEYRGLDAVGKAKIYEAAVSYPIVRSQIENLMVRASFAKKDMTDEIRAVGNEIPKEINVAKLGLSYDKYTTLFGLNAFWSVGGNINLGHLKITDSRESDLNKAGVNTVGTYSKTDVSILGSVALSELLTLSGNVQLQKTLNGKNLDGTEQISISGLNAVKAYPDPEYSADNGIVAGVELNYKLPEIVGISHNVGVFFDIGRGWIEDSGYTNADDRTLSDIGVSYYAKYRWFFAKAQAARIVGGEKVLSQDDYNTRYLLQVGAVF